jgi:hypothetical protein
MLNLILMKSIGINHRPLLEFLQHQDRHRVPAKIAAGHEAATVCCEMSQKIFVFKSL